MGHNQEGEISKRLTGNRATEREAQKHTLSHTLAIVKRERERLKDQCGLGAAGNESENAK
jgi:hypothetical protein